MVGSLPSRTRTATYAVRDLERLWAWLSSRRNIVCRAAAAPLQVESCGACQRVVELRRDAWDPDPVAPGSTLKLLAAAAGVFCLDSKVSVPISIRRAKAECAAGEMNGKSGNINNVCAQMYPQGTKVPGTELLCIFDADQVASKEFFLKTVPLFDGGEPCCSPCSCF